jgi:hypothetical protein
MEKKIGKAPAPRGHKSRKKNKVREQAFNEIAKQYPNLVDSEEKRKELMDIISNIDVAVDDTGQMRMFYKGEEQK